MNRRGRDWPGPSRPTGRLGAWAVFLVGVVAGSGVARAQPAPTGTITPGTLKLPDGPGSVAGLSDEASLDVFHGQVGYSVPFSLPSVGQLAPSLGLSYSGALGNSAVGVGWSLSLAQIARSTRHGVPRYDGSDELELGGSLGSGRLVAIGPDEYRVEGQGNDLRVVRVHNRFELTDGDGVKYYLGLTEAGRQYDGQQSDRIAVWYVQLVVDTAGHAVSFRYQRQWGQVYLTSLVWGPGDRYRARLLYQGRRDAVTSYRSGFAVTTGQRLAQVVVEVTLGGVSTELRRYHLRYEEGLSLSRLAGVRMTGRQGQGELPPLGFGYARRQPVLARAATGLDGWALEERGVLWADVDGDGASDLLRLEQGNHRWRKNLGDGTFAAPQAFVGPHAGAAGLELGVARFLDLDGDDARAELVRIVNEQWFAYRIAMGAQGPRWEVVGPWPGSRGLALGTEQGTGVHADLNGDGRAELVEAATGGIRVFWNRGPELGMSGGELLPRINAAQPEVEPGGEQVRPFDWNGDGLTDFLRLRDERIDVYLGRGDGTFVRTRPVAYPWQAAGPLDLESLHLCDLDRDGLGDLVRVTAGHVLWYAGQGNRQLVRRPRPVARPPGLAYDVRVSCGQDANGNGSADVVWSSPEGMWVLDLAGATSAGMLVTIDNGLGKTLGFAYQASAHLAIEAERAGRPWVYKLPVSIPVPVQMTVDTGIGEPARVVQYGVSDGAWDPVERRFAGFLESRQIVAGSGPGDGRVETTRYFPGLGAGDRVLRGLPWFQRIEVGGQVHTITRSTLEAQEIEGLQGYPLLRKAVATLVETRHYEGVSSPITTRVTTQYDGQGNPIAECNQGRTDGSGDGTLVRRTFASDEQTWVRNRVCQETVYEVDESTCAQTTLVSQVRTFYGDHTSTGGNTGARCDIGKGWVKRTEGLLEEGAPPRWVKLTEFAYDAQANPTTIYEEGVERTIAYDSAGLFPVAETLRPSASAELTWQLAWDPVLGQPLRLTDPNGDVSQVGYDDLGRPVTLAQNNGPAHARYVYDWRAPRPLTHSYVFDGPLADLPRLANAWPHGPPWRHSVTVANGAGEELYSATQMAMAEWIIGGWKERDGRGRVVVAGDAVTWPQAELPTGRPMGMVTQQFRYDGLDRLIEQELPTGAKKQIAYQAFAQTVTADDLAPVRSFLDGQGRVTRTERTIEVLEVVRARFDAAGRITGLCLQGPCAQAGTVEHRFTYDTLGRLTEAGDPDIGRRLLRYNDRGFLTEHENAAGQVVTFSYDGAGRLRVRSGTGGASFTHHYDVEHGGGSTGRVRGRLAWVAEPHGRVELGYDEFGRAARTQRLIGSRTAVESAEFSPSGLLLTIAHDDDFSAQVTYDAAGRTQAVHRGTSLLWQAQARDAAGRLLQEGYGNGVTGVIERDVLGLPQTLQFFRPGAALPTGPRYYDLALTRNAWGGVLTARDRDGGGLDQSATFTYDLAARLRRATVGEKAGAPVYQFSYEYDGLQNMIRRAATGPRDLGILVGTYHYGGLGAGPRQLASIVADGGGPRRDFTYDAAGRLTSDGAWTLTYNELDQLVSALPVGRVSPVEYGYGYDGLRVFTRDPGGAEEYWFTQNLRQRGDLREHYIKLDERIVARVTQEFHRPAALPAAARSASPIPPKALALLAAALTLLLLLGLAVGLLPGPRPRHAAACAAALARRLRSPPRRRRAAGVAGLLVLIVLVASCAWLRDNQTQSLWGHRETFYFHHGFSAGPTLLTRQDGSVFEERRFESFGQPIDAYRELPGGGSQIGPVDFSAEPHNILNKTTDPNTGFSYHGARWMAPQFAQWLTPDPVVKAPDPKFLFTPWELHPYQYVNQNPVVYWDPDGMEEEWTEEYPVIRWQQWMPVPAPPGQSAPDYTPPGTEEFYFVAWHYARFPDGTYGWWAHYEQRLSGFQKQLQSWGITLNPDERQAVALLATVVTGVFGGVGANLMTKALNRLAWKPFTGAVRKIFSGFTQRIVVPRGGQTAVIGKLKDLKNLRQGENTLLKHLPNKGSPKANWKQNAGVLRREMGKGRPIRDASVKADGTLRDNTGFLRAERNLLESKGWTYDPSTQLWSPP